MMPQIDAGRSTEPRTWLPVAIGSMLAATAAAEPDDEPPGVRARSHGFQVGPGSAMVSSVVTVLPTITAPPRRNASTCAASVAGWFSANSGLLHWVGKPRTSKQSLMATGSPSTIDNGRPACQRAGRGIGRLPRPLSVEAHEGLHLGFQRGDAGEAPFEQRARRIGAGRKGLACFGEAEIAAAFGSYGIGVTRSRRWLAARKRHGCGRTAARDQA